MEKYIDKMQKHSENNPLSLSRNWLDVSNMI
jgi:hypothetical protein